METFADIFAAWPSAYELARDLKLKRPSHGTVMKSRGYIPPEYWPRLVEAAERRGIEGISLETLHRMPRGFVPHHTSEAEERSVA